MVHLTFSVVNSMEKTKTIENEFDDWMKKMLEGQEEDVLEIPDESGIDIDIDYSFLNKNEKLNYELKKLPGSKIIFTNGSKKHAETTILKLSLIHI